MLIPVIWARTEGRVHAVRAEHEHRISALAGINSAVSEFGNGGARNQAPVPGGGQAASGQTGKAFRATYRPPRRKPFPRRRPDPHAGTGLDGRPVFAGSAPGDGLPDPAERRDHRDHPERQHGPCEARRHSGREQRSPVERLLQRSPGSSRRWRIAHAPARFRSCRLRSPSRLDERSPFPAERFERHAWRGKGACGRFGHPGRARRRAGRSSCGLRGAACFTGPEGRNDGRCLEVRSAEERFGGGKARWRRRGAGMFVFPFSPRLHERMLLPLTVRTDL